MNPITERKRIYDRIQRLYVHLGLADKMLIDTMIRERNITTIDDIAHSIRNHLIEFGYGQESRELRELHEHQEKWQMEFADYVFERYKKKD